jgi:hypothetical protein
MGAVSFGNSSMYQSGLMVIGIIPYKLRIFMAVAKIARHIGRALFWVQGNSTLVITL